MVRSSTELVFNAWPSWLPNASAVPRSETARSAPSGEPFRRRLVSSRFNGIGNRSVRQDVELTAHWAIARVPFHRGRLVGEQHVDRRGPNFGVGIVGERTASGRVLVAGQ